MDLVEIPFPKRFHDITNRAIGKRKIKRNEKSGYVYGLLLHSIHLDSCTRNERMSENDGFEEEEEEMESGGAAPAEEAEAASETQRAL